MCLPQLRYWRREGAEERGGETYYCHNEMLVPHVRLYYFGSFESNYIMSRNVEILGIISRNVKI
jgi:hypothetical protein